MSEEVALADANIREIQRLRGLLAASQERERIAEALMHALLKQRGIVRTPEIDALLDAYNEQRRTA